MIPWVELGRERAPDGGELVLRQRGGDFEIRVNGHELMSNRAHGSEEAMAKLSCERLAKADAPRVLVGGLGMGFTLRAALDALPARASVVVAELHEAIARWCRGPLAPLTAGAVADPRVALRVGDVGDAIREAAAPGAGGFDAVLLDLYEGPHPASQPREHPHYGPAALARTRAALRAGGVFAVWSEDPDPGFERALGRAGFAVRCVRPGRGGRRHAVYLARAD